MRAFDYQAPATVEGAVALLAKGGECARPFAGGTDLLVQLRRGAACADLLVDVKKIPEMNELSIEADGALLVGAAVALARVAAHPGAAAGWPALADAAGLIGGTAIRSRATLGGNLCNAAPSADSVPAMIVLGATCTVAGLRGRRTLPVDGFCRGPGETALARGELVVAFRLPPPRPRTGSRYLRLTPRGEMDIAVAGVGAWLALGDDGRVAGARIALSAVGPTPLVAMEAAASLVGRAPTDDALAEAAALAQEAARPIDDVRGTARQRRHLVGVLTKRALAAAAERARGEGR